MFQVNENTKESECIAKVTCHHVIYIADCKSTVQRKHIVELQWQQCLALQQYQELIVASNINSKEMVLDHQDSQGGVNIL